MPGKALNIVSTYMVAPMRHQISAKGLDASHTTAIADRKPYIVASLRLRFISTFQGGCASGSRPGIRLIRSNYRVYLSLLHFRSIKCI